jgi:hypothetical protein
LDLHNFIQELQSKPMHKTGLSALIKAFSKTLTTDLQKCETYFQNHNLDTELNNITEILSRIKRKKRSRQTNYDPERTLSSGGIGTLVQDPDDIVDEMIEHEKSKENKKIIRTVLLDVDKDYDLPKPRPQKKPQYVTARPRCLDMFSETIFREFVKSRAEVDIILARIRTDHGSCLEVISNLSVREENLLSNDHLFAYFYHKLSEIILCAKTRVIVAKKFVPQYDDYTSPLPLLKKWGSILDHGNKYQWLAGISHEKVSMSSAKLWSASLESCDQKLFTKIEIDDNFYTIPLI